MLKEQVDAGKKLVRTDTVQMTIGEISANYEAGELNIHPAFQRLFRWTLQKKSDFVESILIGIPVPPVFAYENSEGLWELVDGLQRISTVLEFMGVLRDLDNPKLKLRSILSSTTYLPSLNGAAWELKPDDPEGTTALEKSLQLMFRRARIDFQVLKSPSDEDTKFELFQRLNRGGVYANEQEVRTCAMVMKNAEFTNALRNITEQRKFKSVFRISEDQERRQVDVEMIVRAAVHTFIDYDEKSDVQDFLDKSIITLMSQEKKEVVVERMSKTIDILFETFGDEALLPKDGAPKDIANRFSLRALEAIFVGVSRNIEKIQRSKNPKEFVTEKVKSFWAQDDVKGMSSPGLTGTQRLKRTIPFGTKWFAPDGSN